MTPLCKVGVTLPGVRWASAVRVPVLSMSKKGFGRLERIRQTLEDTPASNGKVSGVRLRRRWWIKI